MIAACGQIPARSMAQAEETWAVIDRLAEGAAAGGADLFLLPETTYPSYWLDSVERYQQPDILRSAEVLRRFAAVAARHRFWLVAGFVEEREGELYNAAAVFDRRGTLAGIARKNFLWDCDNRWFAPGESIQALDTEFGRVGVLICADCRAPEISATLVEDGANMLILPTAWVNAGRQPGQYYNVHPEFLLRARALEFGVPFICCSKSGREGKHFDYVGQSQIVAADGRTLALAKPEGEELIVADVRPGRPRRARMDPETRERLLSRRPAFHPSTPSRAATFSPGLSAAALADSLTTQGARTAELHSAEAASFARPRRCVLDGAQVLLFGGSSVEEAFLRARAAENRVFVIAADDRVHLVVDTDGRVLYRATEPRDSLSIDLSRADNKQFTPETNLWEQRRVACYRLGAAAPVTCGA